MAKIQLLYAENVISRKTRHVRQQLRFFLLVENIGYDKRVDVIWCGEDGVWQTLPAAFHSQADHGSEYWLASYSRQLSAEQSLPGNIRFGLRYRCFGNEYWDNNQGGNYVSQADSGVMLGPRIALHNIGFTETLKSGRKSVPVVVAVDSALQAEKVTIHWTTDNWRHTRKTSCRYQRDSWDRKAQSNARNPNQYGVQIWHARLKLGDAFRVHYSICCETKERTLWDNNRGNNYAASHEPLKVLILNLHCYQEDDQDYKFSQIAKAIDEQRADVVCFQEVAEPWNDGEGDWPSNSANVINERLHKPYHLYTDWAHRGFDKYREGVAILSKYPIVAQESRYVSDSHDVYHIHSRKVVMTRIEVPNIGPVNVFSVHLSWWEDGFQQQFARLRDWADEQAGCEIKGTLLCGDFNITAGSSGYQQVVAGNEYEDQYLAANAHGLFEKIFRVNDPHWRNYLADDYRIDYVFLNKSSQLQVKSARILFTEQDYGTVSDHCGYLMVFEPK